MFKFSLVIYSYLKWTSPKVPRKPVDETVSKRQASCYLIFPTLWCGPPTFLTFIDLAKFSHIRIRVLPSLADQLPCHPIDSTHSFPAIPALLSPLANHRECFYISLTLFELIPCDTQIVTLAHMFFKKGGMQVAFLLPHFLSPDANYLGPAKMVCPSTTGNSNIVIAALLLTSLMFPLSRLC